MTIVILGIDLAKNVFSLHGVDRADKAALVRTSARREQVLEMVAKLLPCTVGIEACSGAHHLAREFAKFGHAGKLMVRTWSRIRRGTTWPFVDVQSVLCRRAASILRTPGHWDSMNITANTQQPNSRLDKGKQPKTE